MSSLLTQCRLPADARDVAFMVDNDYFFCGSRWPRRGDGDGADVKGRASSPRCLLLRGVAIA